MPKLEIRKPEEVPSPSRGTKAVREKQALYSGFISDVGAGDVGELQLAEGEKPRGVKVSLRRAATRMGRELEIWDANGRVYFKAATKRGRPRKSA